MQFVDNLTKIVGNHAFKFGGYAYANNLRVPSDSHRAGELTFNGTRTGGGITVAGENPSPGIGLATFLLGDVTSFGRFVSSSTDASESQPRFFYYARRYLASSARTDGHLRSPLRDGVSRKRESSGKWVYPHISNGQVYVFGFGNSVSPHGIQKMNWHEFAPRFGVAYQLNPQDCHLCGLWMVLRSGCIRFEFRTQCHSKSSRSVPAKLERPESVQQRLQSGAGPSLPTPVTVSSNGTFPLPDGINVKFRPEVITLPNCL